MGQFLKFVLATFVGIVLFVIVWILFLVGVVSSATKEKPVTVESNSVLRMDLNYAIHEKTEDNPFAALGLGNSKLKKAVGLTEIRESIKHAKTDDNIKGILLPIGLNENGLATISAIREALIDFRKSGKFVYAYGEIFSQKGYYLATAADKIFLNPSGGMELKGFGREITYYKGMFDKLGVQVQDFHCGAFKSAIEPYIRENMSDPNRQQLMNLYGDVYNQFLTNISKERKIDTAELNKITNNLLAETPEKDKELNLIDDDIYYDQVLDKIKEKPVAIKRKMLNLLMWPNMQAPSTKTISQKTKLR